MLSDRGARDASDALASGHLLDAIAILSSTAPGQRVSSTELACDATESAAGTIAVVCRSSAGFAVDAPDAVTWASVVAPLACPWQVAALRAQWWSGAGRCDRASVLVDDDAVLHAAFSALVRGVLRDAMAGVLAAVASPSSSKRVCLSELRTASLQHAALALCCALRARRSGVTLAARQGGEHGSQHVVLVRRLLLWAARANRVPGSSVRDSVAGTRVQGAEDVGWRMALGRLAELAALSDTPATAMTVLEQPLVQRCWMDVFASLHEPSSWHADACLTTWVELRVQQLAVNRDHGSPQLARGLLRAVASAVLAFLGAGGSAQDDAAASCAHVYVHAADIVGQLRADCTGGSDGGASDVLAHADDSAQPVSADRRSDGARCVHCSTALPESDSAEQACAACGRRIAPRAPLSALDSSEPLRAATLANLPVWLAAGRRRARGPADTAARWQLAVINGVASGLRSRVWALAGWHTDAVMLDGERGPASERRARVVSVAVRAVLAFDPPSAERSMRVERREAARDAPDADAPAQRSAADLDASERAIRGLAPDVDAGCVRDAALVHATVLAVVCSAEERSSVASRVVARSPDALVAACVALRQLLGGVGREEDGAGEQGAEPSRGDDASVSLRRRRARRRRAVRVAMAAWLCVDWLEQAPYVELVSDATGEALARMHEDVLRLLDAEQRSSYGAIGVPPSLFLRRWLLRGFVGVVPWPALERAWDAFALLGIDAWIRVAAAVLAVLAPLLATSSRDRAMAVLSAPLGVLPGAALSTALLRVRPR